MQEFLLIAFTLHDFIMMLTIALHHHLLETNKYS